MKWNIKLYRKKLDRWTNCQTLIAEFEYVLIFIPPRKNFEILLPAHTAFAFAPAEQANVRARSKSKEPFFTNAPIKMLIL